MRRGAGTYIAGACGGRTKYKSGGGNLETSDGKYGRGGSSKLAKSDDGYVVRTTVEGGYPRTAAVGRI